eukprot:TRINITY_DN7750_c0_g1_i2.p1 TRINITY_DN7750_c0_g1~~TRINITY_DN7750_c0_g1_i2.p1  ORF type:complete len:617 (-),score=123.62 TRINITY_DN7750_c0_g1_i2:95-1945(-)
MGCHAGKQAAYAPQVEEDAAKSGSQSQSSGKRSKVVPFQEKQDGPPRRLKVSILSAAGLRKADWFGLSDPYCSVYFDDEDEVRVKTQICKKTLNPSWNFSSEIKDYRGEAVVFKVWDWDMVGSHDFLGTARVQPEMIPAEGTGLLELPLQEAGKDEAYLRIKLNINSGTRKASKELPQRKITVGVQKARGLRKADTIGKSDPYCCVEFEGDPTVRAKTNVIKTTYTPQWNFSGEVQDWRDEPLVFKVWDWDRVGSHDFLGVATLTPDRFLPRGTDWIELPLEEAGKNDAFITVRVKFDADEEITGWQYNARLGKLVPVLEKSHELSSAPLLNPTAAFGNDFAGRSVEEQIEIMYPEADYEITCYGFLKSITANDEVWLQNFENHKPLNGLKGQCYEVDNKRWVWLIRLEKCGRKVRVLPEKYAPKIKSGLKKAVAAKYIKGNMVYGSLTAQVMVDAEYSRKKFALDRMSEKALKTSKKIERPYFDESLDIGTGSRKLSLVTREIDNPINQQVENEAIAVPVRKSRRESRAESNASSGGRGSNSKESAAFHSGEGSKGASRRGSKESVGSASAPSGFRRPDPSAPSYNADPEPTRTRRFTKESVASVRRSTKASQGS